ncbi:right-handed parallel beta-helix repeat-containing protein [Hydrocoleum sp. CS-953]|uniref:right-handed parallel beta-helix repeat-containing protein n=1 Tax=Hydrocoleum sp. CS-953 TaxID=1671698 RepID=UPI00143D3296|nr:right-handed parallel beta-helix repeat-containing protein [Hydrocoleum sp. CS-953]
MNFPNNYEFVKYEPENNNPVDEDLVSKIIYVNPKNIQASDTNPGTEELPLKTLNKATEIARKNYQNNLGTKAIIYPGIYRESVELIIQSNNSNVPIIFEAKEPGKVIVSGSDIWNNWTQYQNSKIYTHNWPYKWEIPDNPWPNNVEVTPIVRRKEIAFINSKLLKQKLSLAELTEGSFYISDEEDKIYIFPELGIDINNSIIEVGIRNSLFLSKGFNNLVIRGITFQHASSNFRDAAVSIRSGKNILVENSQFLWNNWQGLHIRDCENLIVRKITANYNGQRGVGGYKLRNTLYEDVETSYNNWRGDWGGFYGWDAGHKFFYLRNVTFRRYTAVGNMAAGLWLDLDNSNVWIDQAYICDNFHTGLYIEVSHHILVSNSKICRNRANPESLFHHPGIFGSNASYVTLENNLICGNDRSQIKFYLNNKREIKNGYTKDKYFLNGENWVLRNNTIIGKNSSQLLIYLQPTWEWFTDSWISENNTWYNPDTSNSFQIKDRGKAKNFEDWQSIVSLDKESVFTQPEGKLDCI